MISIATITFWSSFVRLQNTNFTSTFAPSQVCVPYTRRRKCRRRYWSGRVRTEMRTLRSSDWFSVVAVSFERAHRPNLSKLLNRTSLIAANKQRKKMTVKQEQTNRPRLGFEDLEPIVFSSFIKESEV
ncbi:hypothetical protein V8G54_014003 [Vigna mungo]|uniref:Uncharacterized protein n=1 Tax=Vigna mungo TaxID=3915 RepID=A0AAQ3NJW5_VIGMU